MHRYSHDDFGWMYKISKCFHNKAFEFIGSFDLWKNIIDFYDTNPI